MIHPLPFFLAQGQAQGLIGMVPFVLVLFIFYFLVIRPQQTEQKSHASLLASLKKDDRVTTTGGLHGKVVEVREHLVVVEIADRVRVIIDKPAVKARLVDGAETTATKEPEVSAGKGT